MAAIRLAVTLTLAFSAQAHADALSAGNRAYAKGDYAKALAKWQESGIAVALNNIAVMAEAGHVEGCDPVRCAADWFLKAGDDGYLPAITHLGLMNFDHGFKDQGQSFLNIAARWGDALARSSLIDRGLPVPEPDLYAARLAELQAAEAQRATSQQEADRNLAAVLAAGVSIWAAGQQGTANAYQQPAFGSRSVPLSVQNTVGFQRQCDYLTPSGMVTVIVNIATSCPPNYAY